MTGVLLSVVIPTHARPEYLKRAIQSALGAAPEGSVEVLVVPNGSDKSWIAASREYSSERRVRWLPIRDANANAARNHGMANATGEYIRFLDDDDYLYPDTASAQLDQAIRTGADLSFGSVDAVDSSGHIRECFVQMDTTDFTVAALSPTHATATTGLVYKRGITIGLRWEECVSKRQDIYWAWSLCTHREIESVRYQSAVGAWVAHGLPRVSQGHAVDVVLNETTRRLLNTVDELKRQDRLTGPRARAASNHLWLCVHQGMLYSPLKWLRVADHARDLDPQGRPPLSIYQAPIVRHISPLIIALFYAPWRLVRISLGHKYHI